MRKKQQKSTKKITQKCKELLEAGNRFICFSVPDSYLYRASSRGSNCFLAYVRLVQRFSRCANMKLKLECFFILVGNLDCEGKVP